jgi:hypothetical protein
MTQWGLDTLFNPAKRHMDEEKRRLQSTREEIGDSSGGKRIDLESGKVTISRGQPKDADDADGQADADSAETDDGAAPELRADSEPAENDGKGADADQPG